MVMSNPRAELPEDAKHVPVSEAHEYGYHGIVPDPEDNHVYTVAGVTENLPGPSGTAKSDDPPNKEAAARSRSNTAALKKGDDK
jgi:hypothetical protein